MGVSFLGFLGDHLPMTEPGVKILGVEDSLAGREPPRLKSGGQYAFLHISFCDSRGRMGKIVRTIDGKLLGDGNG